MLTVARRKLADFIRPAERKKVRMKPRSRLTNFFAGFQHDRIAGGAGQGGFAAGKIDRFTDEWNPGTIGPNRMFLVDGRLVRERAWDLVRNNPYAKSAVGAYLDNVIETGILPKPQYPDRGRRKMWQDAWEKWGGLSVHATNEADLSGVQTVNELQRLWLTECVVGGGCLLHFIETSRRFRSVPLAIEMIPEERFADDLLQSNRNSKTANPVVNGVEIDPRSGRHLAYWIRRTHPNDLSLDFEREPQRIGAENARYGFFRDRVGQHRGMTLLKTAVVWLWALGYYTDSELRASDMKSSWAFMVKTDAAAGLDWPDLSDADPETGATDIFGNTIEKLEPGMVWRGAVGDEIEAVGPNVPGADSLPWITMIQASIAIGLGLSHQEMMRDYGRANFAAARMTRSRDKKTFRPLQTFTAQNFLNPIVRRFTAHAARAGLPGFPSPSEFLENEDEWLKIKPQAPGWESANPKEDATADDLSLANGSADLSQIAERKGDDWESMLERQAIIERRRQQLEAEHGVTLPRPGKQTPVGATASESEDAEPETNDE